MTFINNISTQPLKCASAFSGIGSFELALKNLNIEHTNEYIIEIDIYARKTFLANNSVNTIYEDITKIDVKKVPEVDLLLLSPPCQSFSNQGKQRGFDDTRGTLIYDGFRLIQASQPKVVIFENVKGYISHDNGNTLDVTLNSFKALGYNVQYQVLNAKNFDTAQNRERLFIIAIRKDVNLAFSFPTAKPVSKSINDYILANVDYSDCIYDATGRVPYLSKVKTDIKKLYLLPHIKFSSDKRICSTDGIAPTIVASSAKTKFFDTKNRLFRYLTLDEMASIQGFSKDFIFPVSNTQKKKQIGNSISVPVLEAIIEELFAKSIPINNSCLVAKNAA